MSVTDFSKYFSNLSNYLQPSAAICHLTPFYPGTERQLMTTTKSNRAVEALRHSVPSPSLPRIPLPDRAEKGGFLSPHAPILISDKNPPPPPYVSSKIPVCLFFRTRAAAKQRPFMAT